MIPYGKQTIDEEDKKAVLETLNSGFLTCGPKVDEFEKRFSEYIGCKYAVAVSNGTAALDLGVASLKLKKGSEVIVTPFTFVASSNCILYNGLTPVFCDINPKTLNIDVKKIEEKITKKTKAILYVDFAGRPCDYEKLKEIADKHKLYLIEDASHAVGSEVEGKKVGSLADITTFSFHPVKTMTSGEGGMITTNDERLADELKLLRNHGINKKKAPKDKKYGEDAFYEYDVLALGKNYRLTDINCSLGISQLKKLDSFIEIRQRIVDKYNESLKNLKGLSLPIANVDLKNKFSWHIYYVLLDENINKNKFLNIMKSKNIGVHSFYIPIYNFTYYKSLFGEQKENFPVAEDIFRRIVVLPLYSLLKNEEVDYIIKSVKETLEIIQNEPK